MGLKILNCPKCERETIQGKKRVPIWNHRTGGHSDFTEKVSVCSVCGSYIVRRKVWVTKYFDPHNYSFD